jgi:hypothetical protein
MYEIFSNQLWNGVTSHSFGSCSGLTKTTENLAIFGFVVLIYTGNDGGRGTKDDGEPNSLSPRTTENLAIFISLGVLHRQREKGVSNTKDNR